MRPTVISASVSLYTHVVRCYPPGLRVEFGETLVNTFAEELEASWARNGWRGAWRAWRGVITDMATIVIPHWLELGTPAILAIICAAVIYGSMLGLIDPNKNCQR
jgi:hypothetical protein